MIKTTTPKRTTILRPFDMPEQYCLRAEGRCMEPIFFSDDPLLIDRTRPLKIEGFIAVWLRRELVRPGEHQIIVKRLSGFRKVNGVESVVLEMLNPKVRLALPLSGVEAMHVCLGVVPRHIKRVKQTDEEWLADTRNAA